MATTQPKHPKRRFLGRFTSSDTEVEAEGLRTATEQTGAKHASECCLGEVVTLHGVVRTLTLHPSTTLPKFEVEMYDGSGMVRLVWLGRRRIVGIEPGRGLRVTGRLTSHKVATRLTSEKVSGRMARQTENLVMFNPRYELLPVGTV